jgi:hypothetical protein
MAVAALGALVMTAGPAGAQVPCTGTGTASPAAVSPSSILPGESITISGGGFAANQVLGIGLFQPPAVLASVASDVYGNYAATIQLPLNTPPGQNEITVFGHGPDLADGTPTCHQSLALFTVRELPQPVPVISVYTPPVTYLVAGTPAPIVVQQPLARTGASSPVLVAAGLVMMLLGFHVVRMTGRRGPLAG